MAEAGDITEMSEKSHIDKTDDETDIAAETNQLKTEDDKPTVAETNPIHDADNDKTMPTMDNLETTEDNNTSQRNPPETGDKESDIQTKEEKDVTSDVQMEEENGTMSDIQMKVEGVEEPDEYNYTRRDEFTSEIFKLCISNLPRHFGFKELKKKMSKLNVIPVKMKVWNEICFVTFRNDEDKMGALEKLNGLRFKGKDLVVETARPAADPLMRKRKQENRSGNHGDKKQKLEEDGLTPLERLKNSVTPLWKLEYKEQLKRKQEEMYGFMKRYHKQLEKNCPDLNSWLREMRRKHGGIPCQLLDVLPSPVTSGYRNKCEFTIGPGMDESEPSVVGFRYGTYAEGTVCVGSAEEVDFIPDIMKPLLKSFQEYLRKSQFPAYNPENHTGNWRQLTVRISQLKHVMIMVDFNPQQLSQEELSLEQSRLMTYFTEGEGKACSVTSAFFRAHSDKTTSSDVEYIKLFGDKNITEDLLGMKFQISPPAFFQVNTLGAEVLYKMIGEWCTPTEKTTVLDVCCGTGTIGLTVAKSVEKVIGIEMCAAAIDNAKINAQLNGIENVTYHCAKAEDVMKDITRSVWGCEKVVAIVDPPRGGLHSRVLIAIRNCRTIDRLVYVSCNVNGALNNLIDLVRPTSKRLTGPRFLPMKAVPVDLFPHTTHCEMVLLFEREKTDT